MLVQAPAAIHTGMSGVPSGGRTGGRQDNSPHGYGRPPSSPQPQAGPGVSGASPQPLMPSQYMQAPQPAYWPATEPMYVVGLHELILNQVHYYFSAENLCRDEFLRSQMDRHEGWLGIQLLATFNRLRSLTSDVHVIAEARRHRHAHRRQPPRTLRPAVGCLGGGIAQRLRHRLAPRLHMPPQPWRAVGHAAAAAWPLPSDTRACSPN